ncbi:MAG: YebC/PmpR family DNA-binding transcriptional regulator, partial [Clostridia bacterium]
KKGIMVIDKANCSFSEDDLMLLAIDSGAEDFSAEEEVYEITTAPESFSQVREKLEAEGIEFLEAGVQMIPSTYIALDEKGAERMERLLEMLEDLDDVSEIYHNWEE